MLEAGFLVVGAGIAGASIAAKLAAHGTVVMIEAEDQPGYHSTGRSAAMFTETYGPSAIRALTAASRAFLCNPPDGFTEGDILSPRGILLIGGDDQRGSLEQAERIARDSNGGRRLDRDQALALAPILRPDNLAGAVLEPDAMEIDVHALHTGFLRQFKARGGQLVVRARLQALRRTNGHWRAETTAGPVTAATLVNAAGAWADVVAEIAGIAPIGLVPKRRTAVVFEPTDPVDTTDSPMIADVDEAFYVKPEAGRFLASPEDETPMPPCDVQPDELDIAITMDRVERATTLSTRRLINKWAGLRSFVADGLPVVGWDNRAEGFFWLAAQGGYGIQTSPAISELAVATLSGNPVPPECADRGITDQTLSPDRLVDRN